MLVHIAELSAAEVKVDIKVITGNDNLTQNQCLQCVPLPLTYVEILPLCNATELNNDWMIKFVNIH